MTGRLFDYQITKIWTKNENEFLGKQINKRNRNLSTKKTPQKMFWNIWFTIESRRIMHVLLCLFDCLHTYIKYNIWVVVPFCSLSIRSNGFYFNINMDMNKNKSYFDIFKFSFAFHMIVHYIRNENEKKLYRKTKIKWKKKHNWYRNSEKRM